MTTAGRPWYRNLGDFVVMSPVLLWTLLKVSWWLKWYGLQGTLDRATSVSRPPVGSPVPSAYAQRWRAAREDEIICWWMVVLRLRAICLFRSLVMVERLSRLPGLETIELVLGIRRGPGGTLDGHAWLVANGEDFREYATWETFAVLQRFVRRPRREAAG